MSASLAFRYEQATQEVLSAAVAVAYQGFVSGDLLVICFILI